MLLFEKPSLTFGMIGIPPNAPEGTQPQARLAAILCDEFDAADLGRRGSADHERGTPWRCSRSLKASAWSRHALSPSGCQSIAPSMISAGIVTSAAIQPICALP
jgi:hypothetical protein